MKHSIKILVIVLLISICYNSSTAQLIEKKMFSFSMDYGVNYFFNEDGFYKHHNITLNAFSINGSYILGEHEIGVVLGKSDIATKRYFQTEIQSGETTILYNDNYLEPETINWYGLEYKYNFRNSLNFGFKLAHQDGGGTYHEFSLGKKFNVSEYIFLRLSVNYSISTINLFEFKSSSHYQLGTLAGFYIRL